MTQLWESDKEVFQHMVFIPDSFADPLRATQDLLDDQTKRDVDTTEDTRIPKSADKSLLAKDNNEVWFHT